MADDPNNPTLVQPAPASVPPAPPVSTPAEAPIRIPDPTRPGGFKEYASLDALVQSRVEADEHIRRLEAQAAQLLEKQQQVVAAVGATPTPAEPRFDNDQYFRLLAEDPMKAYQYQKQFDPEWQAAKAYQQQTRLQSTVQVFFAQNPDFTQNEQNFNSLLDAATQLGFREESLTPQQLTAAYAYAKTLAVRQPAPAPAQPAQPGAVPPPRLPLSANPITPGEQKLADDIWNARTRAEADDIARKAGLLP